MPEFNLLFILTVLKKYKWYILGVTVLSGILAFIFTMPSFYPPQYMSQTIIYPTNSERFDAVNVLSDKDVYLFGGTSDAERLVSAATSERTALFIIDSLNLWTVYGIDPKNDASPKFKVLKEFAGNINVVRSEGAGVQVTAYDIDPQRAADIVNLIILNTNTMTREMLERNRENLRTIYKANMLALEKIHHSYLDSIKMMRKTYNTFSYADQTEVLLNQTILAQKQLSDQKGRLSVLEKNLSANDTAVVNTKARIKGAELALQSISGGGSEVNISKFREGIDKTIALEQYSFRVLATMQETREKLEALNAISNMDYSPIHTTEKATASDKKARPVRWVILLASLVISLGVSTFAAILIDYGIPAITSSLKSDS